MFTTNDNLGRKEALLLLYVADELPAAERAEVDQMLASDELLRGMLDELRSLQDQVSTGLARVDTVQPLGKSEIASVARRTIRSMRQFQAEQLSRRPVAPTPQVWRPGWRTYSLGSVAAALIVAMFVWWFNPPQDTMMPAPENFALSLDDQRELYEVIEPPADDGEPDAADLAAQQLALAIGGEEATGTGLAGIELEASRLLDLSSLSRAEDAPIR